MPAKCPYCDSPRVDGYRTCGQQGCQSALLADAKAKEQHADHLGDGVYAAIECGMIRLTTGAHEGPHVTNTIYLEPEIYAALVRYVDRVRASFAKGKA